MSSAEPGDKLKTLANDALYGRLANDDRWLDNSLIYVFSRLDKTTASSWTRASTDRAA